MPRRNIWVDSDDEDLESHIAPNTTAVIKRPTPQTGKASNDLSYEERVRQQLFSDANDSLPTHTKPTTKVQSTNDAPNSAANVRQQIYDLQQKTLAHTERSTGLIYNSEDVGMQTARELVEQGEKLENVNRNLDTLNKDLKTANRHVTSLKSVFGGIKNYFSGGSDTDTKPTTNFTSQYRPSDSLDRVLEDSQPAKPTKQTEFQKFHSKDDELFNNYESKIANNMDSMNAGLSKLKHLSIGLGDEIDHQNQMLDKINYKTEGAKLRMDGFNRDLSKLLKN